MSEKERVEKIRGFLKFNKKTFSEVLGYKYSQHYTKYLNGTSSLSVKAIKSLVEYDSRFNINWILLGQGQMLISQGSNNSQNITNDNGTISQITNNDNSTKTNNPIELELLRKEVEHLKKSLKDKEDMLEAKEEIIQLLKK